MHAWVPVALDALRQAGKDRVTGMAAELAFWVLLSLAPLLLATAALAGLVGDRIGGDVRNRLIARIGELAGGVFSDTTVDAVITPTLDGLLTDGPSPLLSLSFLVTVYLISRVFHVLVHAVAISYGMQEPRPSWLARLMGFVFTIVGLVLALPVIPLVVAGPQLGEVLETRMGFDTLQLTELWAVLYWPVSFGLIASLLTLLFHYATPWRTPFKRDVPGAVLATVLGLFASVGLRTYTGRAFEGNSIYAALAAPLAILVWVWLQSISLLMGAELNAAIERADPVRNPLDSPRSLDRLGRKAARGMRKLANSGRKS